MTKRDDTAVMVLHDSLESDERASMADEPEQAEESAAVGSDPSASSEDGACEIAVLPTAEGARFTALMDLPDAAGGRAARPTLMGLAPLERDTPSEAANALSAKHADAEPRAHQQAPSEPETSTVRPTRLLASALNEEQREDDAPRALVSADDHEPAQGDAAAASDTSTSAALHVSSEATQHEPDAASASLESPQAGEAPVQLPTSLSLEQQPSAEAQKDSESEWLDLSTRWLVATGPQSELPPADENEVTDLAHWADRLSARVGLPADSHSSAPPPPPQPLVAAQSGRRPTIAYGRPHETLRHAYAGALGAPQAGFDALGQRQQAREARRHATLAGISALPEERSSWSTPRESRDYHSVESAGAAPNPWREEPSYSDAPQPQSHGPGPAAAAYAAGTLPPWAAHMSPYAMPPSAAMMPPYPAAAWNGAHVPSAAMMPPWAATANYGVPLPHQQYVPPGAYATGERPSRSHGYAAPDRATGARPSRMTQQNASVLDFEQWKSFANTWFATLAKCGVAVMALHYSGLAVPLLAYFGYTPASGPAQASANDSAVHAPAPVAASLAASSVIPDGLSPSFAEETAFAASQRRRTAKREAEPRQQRHVHDAAREASSTGDKPLRRHGSKPAHKQKLAQPAHAKGSRHAAAALAAAATPAVAAPAGSEPQPESSATAQPLLAAAPATDKAAGEAFLRINSRPWSQVFIDGTHVGHTPKLDLRVSPGAHRIRLVNADLGVSKTIELIAAAGETLSHVERFDE